MSRKNAEEMSIGEDSFLDTTANLVGILIILVVLVGSKTTIEAREYGEKMVTEESIDAELEDPVRQARALEGAILDQQRELLQHDMEAEYRRLERDRLLTAVAVAREKVDTKLASLGVRQRQAIEEQQRVEQLESQLKKTQEIAGAASDRERPKIILEHLPTPMAKTVFGRELHVRVQNQLVTVVPWDRLIEMLKQQVPLAYKRNASRRVLEETLGPVGGFLMRYRMVAVPGGLELDRFELETTPDNRGEPLETALSNNGQLRLTLASRQPSETVVTVWVYPDSFETFRKLKSALFEEGFLCAARPLPDGMRIGASPHGSRSSAQ